MASSRRHLLKAACATAVTLSARAQGTPTNLLLMIRGDRRVSDVPEDFTGLSYETGELATPSFFAPDNEKLIALFRKLSPKGVLRLGGNSSDKGKPVSAEAITNLARFLDRTDWALIYGLNLGANDPARTAAEARAVNAAVGKRLVAFHVGNEPDLYGKNGLRPQNWSVDDYLAQWQQYFGAVRESVPDAPFAGPDVASSVNWIKAFVQEERRNVVLLTGHYYAEGPPTDPRMNIERLLQPDPRLGADLAAVMTVAKEARLPFRMSEANSCWSGGRTGVSDTFASALWAADYELQIARAGCMGVNLHSGAIYTPIAGTPDSGFAVRPVYYGLLVAQQFAGGSMLQTSMDAQGLNVTAYAAQKNGRIQVAVFNKDQHPVTVSFGVPQAKRGVVWRLTAPALDSKTDVSFAAAPEDPIRVENRNFNLPVPSGSAALVFLE